MHVCIFNDEIEEDSLHGKKQHDKQRERGRESGVV